MKNYIFTAILFVIVMFLNSDAIAGEIQIKDAYLRSSHPSTAAAFMQLINKSDVDDRLLAVASNVAERVELHSHRSDSNGIMRMVPIESGITIPAKHTVMLERGGNHIMFLGLTENVQDGDEISLILTFELAGDIKAKILVDSNRRPSFHQHNDDGG
ncbi:MAG: copper chaperone PCu(A)C [Aestuariivita sp.]|nr:copper chaperone PCu(A)C [Aestuariivita sp.]